VRRHLPHIAIALAVSTFLLSTSVPAQLPDPPIRPAASRLWVRPAGAPDAIPVGIEAGERSDHTVLGLIVGAGLGFVAGWGFYNAMCEAVDNDCSGSRTPYLVFGASIGAGLGALIGSVAE
jgi:hypothetical protein